MDNGIGRKQAERSYLFGRALAYARRLEELSQWASGNEPRQTNAERMQVTFYEHPCRTWLILYHQLAASSPAPATGPWAMAIRPAGAMKRS